MNNICDYDNEGLFCNLGLYQEISIDCNDFCHESHVESEYDRGFDYFEYIVHEIKYSKQFNRLIDFMLDTNNIYLYCPLCGKQMSFKLFPEKLSEELVNTVVETYSEFHIDADFSTSEHKEMSERINKIVSENRIFDKVIRCTHNNSHVFKFFYLLKKKGDYPNEFLTLTKIGQYPSINDLNSEHIRHYNKLLKEYSKEYTKALGLYSAGIGIGSFVYLRRIIEFLLENAFNKAEKQGVITREEYLKEGTRNRRFDEKITILKEYLPEFMGSNVVIYNIISKGIHELDEDECKEIFPVLQKSIELILDEEIAIRQKEAIIKSAQQELEKIKSRY